MKDYVIAVRSYRRSDTIKNKTLRVLQQDKIPKDNIYLFVGSDEIDIYKKSVGPGYHVVDGGSEGTNACNKKIIKYFPKNQYIIQTDDDINFILKLNNQSAGRNKKSVTNKKSSNRNKTKRKIINGRIEPLGLHSYSIKHIIKEGKQLMDKYNYNLWGMYPVPNYYFMKNEISTNLKFCIGRVFGFNNTKDVICNDDCRDDYERSILYYDRDGGIIRFNHYVCDADTYIGKGGLAESRTIEKMKQSCDYLLKKYPQYVRPKKCKSQYPEIRLVSNSK